MSSHLGYLKYSLITFLLLFYSILTIYAQNILGNDTLVCSGQYITLNAGPNGPYLWSTGETTQGIRVYQDGDYAVTAGGITDTVKVTIYNQSYNQASHWVFGNGISLKFDTSSQTNYKVSEKPLQNSFSIPAGSSSAVNNDGNLLFFSDGESIYDSSGKVVVSGLAGDKNIAQNSLIVPLPGSAVEYYIFTIENHQLFYSIVHLDAAKNISVVKKNILLADGVDNKLSAITNGDNTGMWIMTHKQYSNTFQAFLLTKGGITPPVLSSTGQTTNDSPGYLKFSPDGSRLAIASDFTEVFYFDKSSGAVSFPKHLFFTSSYGLEFSPNSNYLYVTSTNSTKTDSAGPITPGGSLVRVNISYGYKTDIISGGNASTSFGALQLGNDGKIYVVKGDNNQSCLGTINDPRSDQIVNNYTPDALCVAGTTTLGLPNFPQHYFTKSSNFFFFPTSPCEGDSMQIIAGSRLINLPYAKFSIQYDFGDPASGAENTSTQLTPKHFYPGKEKVYEVKAFTKDVCKSNTITSNSFIIPRPRMAFKDTVVCPNAPLLLLDAANNYKSVGTGYLWILGKDTLSKKQTFTPPSSGIYRVEVKIGGQCDTSNTIRVAYKTFPPFDLGPAKNLCDGDSAALSPLVDLSVASFIWSTGDTSKKIIIETSGTYWLRITDQGCSISDTVDAMFFPKPLDPDLKSDSAACFGTSVLLDAANPGNFKYTWSSGETSRSISVTKGGLYSVTIYNPGCSQVFSSNLYFQAPIAFPTDNPVSICEKDNQLIELDAGSGTDWIWSNGTESNRRMVISKAGDYSVVKKDSLTGCPGTASYHIYSVCKPKIYFPTTFTPNEDGSNEIFKPYAKNVISYRLNIFNRWGELIYFTENIDNGWDGTYKGEPSPIDNYIYTVNYEGEGIKETTKFTIKGSLILLR
jgi:gliding motility-associated-like protein